MSANEYNAASFGQPEPQPEDLTIPENLERDVNEGIQEMEECSSPNFSFTLRMANGMKRWNASDPIPTKSCPLGHKVEMVGP
jgi:hypothetical protein